jgi:hypothetical protein
MGLNIREVCDLRYVGAIEMISHPLDHELMKTRRGPLITDAQWLKDQERPIEL